MAGHLERAASPTMQMQQQVQQQQQQQQVQQQQQQHHPWNHHLQVPAYYPRHVQPQAAHMSSESRSPLTWHTPTPPDYRHTPTPPDKARTPTPPFYHKTNAAPLSSSPLFNLQQMIPMRDCPPGRGDTLPYARRSPNIAVGSVDLSVSRSPLGSGQNGESGAPMSLSVRDASKINSFDPTELARIHRALPTHVMKASDVPEKSESPTLNLTSQRSNSPKSPKSMTNRRPVKKVDSILERLNSSGGVADLHSKPSQSVIVSAHALDEGKVSSPSVISSLLSVTGHAPLEGELKNIPQNVQAVCENSAVTISAIRPEADPVRKDPTCESQSVIRESSSSMKDASPSTANYSNDDSNGSSSDSSKSRRRRKQLKTNKVESVDVGDGNHDERTLLNPSPKTCLVDNDRLHSNNPENDIDSGKVENLNPIETTAVESLNKTDGNSVTPKTRRKTSSESETIDDIAAMIASSYSSEADASKDTVSGNSQSINDFTDVLSKSPNSRDANKNSSSSPSKSVENIIEQLDSKDVEKTLINNFVMDTSSKDNTSEQNKSKTPKDGNFGEVENELEKMFAGIEEHNSSDVIKPSDTLPLPALQEHVTEEISPEPVVKKETKKKKSRKSADANALGLLSSDENPPKKRRKQTKKRKAEPKCDIDNPAVIKSTIKKNKLHQPTKDAYDSGSNASSSKSRGPYLQIRGPRDSPLSVSVINTPVQEEDYDKPLQKMKSMKSKGNFSIDVSFKNKVKSRGLHSSTLSMKYDATTTDTSWICVFCKKGPHTGPARHGDNSFKGRSQHMGDLFGPYIVTTECPDYVSMLNDPHDAFFKGKPKSGVVPKRSSKKLKLDQAPPECLDASKLTDEETYQGMTEAAGGNAYEVWLHEDCAVWAPGLYLVGAKIVGLDAAVWSCCTVRCDMCCRLGATVACIKHGCTKTMHVNCARADMWSLSEDNFLVYCREHGLPLLP